MARRNPARRKMPPKLPDPQGQVALMVCESLLHLLIEERVIAKDKALAAIDGIAELVMEMDNEAGSQSARDHTRTALSIIERLRNTFAAKSTF